MQDWTFFAVTFGCKVNQYETEAIREAWTRAGGREVTDMACAHVALVNSCAVTSRGERDARNALVRIRRENPSALIIITGCSTRLVASFVPRANAPTPEADIYVPQESKDTLAGDDFAERLARAACALGDKLGGAPSWRDVARARLEAASTLPFAGLPAPTAGGRTPERENSLVAYPRLAIAAYRRMRPVLKVQDGCSHRCTYCIVPLMRGRSVSRPADEVIREARALFADHAEIMVSGINLSQYGRDDRAPGDFWDLLARLDEALAPEFAGRRRLRVSSLEPSQLDARAVDILRRTRLVAPHLHISLQHASQKVLRRMGRGHYTATQLLEGLERMADFWPDPGLGADLLVGFPGETEEDVEELCRFVRQARLSYAHVFPYSRRPGTPAATFPGQLPRKVKLERAARVRAVTAESARAFWKAQLKRPVVHIALDAHESNGMAGYLHGVDERYVPCFLPLSLAGSPLPAEPSLAPAPAVQPASFVAVHPVGLCEKGVLVEPVHGETTADDAGNPRS